ncbi:hypothetical protein D3C71_517620 [compost metagenome]
MVLTFRSLRVQQLLLLGDQVNDIHTESVNAFIQPPSHHIVDFLTDFRVLPVQIRLLAGE